MSDVSANETVEGELIREGLWHKAAAMSSTPSAESRFTRTAVRRQGFWDRWAPELREDLAYLVYMIMRRICGEASAGFRWSLV